MLIPSNIKSSTLPSLYPHNCLNIKQLPKILDLCYLDNDINNYTQWTNELVISHKILVINNFNNIPDVLRIHIPFDTLPTVPHLIILRPSILSSLRWTSSTLVHALS